MCTYCVGCSTNPTGSLRLHQIQGDPGSRALLLYHLLQTLLDSQRHARLRVSFGGYIELIYRIYLHDERASLVTGKRGPFTLKRLVHATQRNECGQKPTISYGRSDALSKDGWCWRRPSKFHNLTTRLVNSIDREYRIDEYLAPYMRCMFIHKRLCRVAEEKLRDDEESHFLLTI